MKTLFAEFVRTVLLPNDGAVLADLTIETTLQREFAKFLRTKYAGATVKMEHNMRGLPGQTSKRADIVVTDGGALLCAVEIKFPRSGAVPNNMFGFCKDIAKAEHYRAMGFATAAAVIVTADPLFYRGKVTGIYAPFRSNGAVPVTGRIPQATGKGDDAVNIAGSYPIHWLPIAGSFKYAVVGAGT